MQYTWTFGIQLGIYYFPFIFFWRKMPHHRRQRATKNMMEGTLPASNSLDNVWYTDQPRIFSQWNQKKTIHKRQQQCNSQKAEHIKKISCLGIENLRSVYETIAVFFFFQIEEEAIARLKKNSWWHLKQFANRVVLIFKINRNGYESYIAEN